LSDLIDLLDSKNLRAAEDAASEIPIYLSLVYAVQSYALCFIFCSPPNIA